MSSLSSASTDAEVWAAYDDNASYAEDNSASKAAAFVTACRILLRRTPKRARQGMRHEVEFDPATLRKELEAAQQWIASNSTTGGGIKHVSFQGFRG